MPVSAEMSFALDFHLNLKAVAPGELVALGEAIRIYIREAGTDAALLEWDMSAQNYLNFPDADGRVLVLEAELRFQTQRPDRKMLRVGCPLAVLRPLPDHVISIRIHPFVIQLLVDGELQDEEWPVDPLLAWRGEPQVTAPAGRCAIVAPAPGMLTNSPPPGPLQYFAPPGHNAWAGDTISLTHDGVFHLYYLIDRRHGASKFRCGGHQVAHASSADLRTWTHHPLALAITEPWMTYGTGMPIVRDGEILLFYGLHTDRVVPRDETCVPAIESHLALDGTTSPVGFMQEGKFPMGSAIARSRDGIRFTIDPRIIHHCQNPSPFTDPLTGRVYLLAGYGDQGCYETDELVHWRLADKHFLPHVKEIPQGNTLECQCFFEWNGWYYLLAGRTGFWMSRQPLGPYWEGAKNAADGEILRPRWDPYDGLWVPTIATWQENRRILAGWIAGPDVEWAGHLVFRELVQHEDGTLGTKWPEEMIPETTPRVREPVSMALEASGGFTQADAGGLPPSCRVSMTIRPAGTEGSFGIRIGSCELKFTPRMRRAQWNTARRGAGTPDLPTLEEIMAQEPYQPIWSNPHPNIHFKGGDFTIQNVEGLDEQFTLELIVLYDEKSNSTIIDACIDQRRTLITRRPGLRVDALNLFAHGTSAYFSSVTVRPIVK